MFTVPSCCAKKATLGKGRQTWYNACSTETGQGVEAVQPFLSRIWLDTQKFVGSSHSDIRTFDT